MSGIYCNYLFDSMESRDEKISLYCTYTYMFWDLCKRVEKFYLLL